MNDKNRMTQNDEITIPDQLIEQLLQYAAEIELSVEEIVEISIKNYLERNENIA